jgi:DNA mismatch repair ATPase MutS
MHTTNTHTSTPSQVLAQGYSVGRVEEMPPAAGGSSSSKLLVRRLVRIYTPGTAVEGLLLDDQVNNDRLAGCHMGAAPRHPKKASSVGMCGRIGVYCTDV